MKFSIIVPVYNTALYLRECFDSIRRQTVTDWECLCIDDGSSDGSETICDEYAQKDKRFVVVHQKNKGLTATRNVGLRMAQGEYVCFVDCDDAILENWLEVADSVIRQTQVDLVRLWRRNWQGEAYEPRCRNYDTKMDVHRGKEAVYRWGWPMLNKGAWVWLQFVRRDRLKDFAFVEKRIYREDIISSLHMLSRVDSVCQLNYPGYLYRERQGSMMHSKMRVPDLLNYWSEFRDELLRRKTLLQDLHLWDMAVAQYGQALSMSARMWTEYRVQSESGLYRELSTFLRGVMSEGLLRIQDVKRGWRLVFLLYCKTGFFVPFHVLYRIAVFFARCKGKMWMF